MEFKEKQFDGPYEVSEVEIHKEGQIFRGILYFPPKNYKKPYPIIIWIHGFPQLFTLNDIVKSYSYLLDLGYSLLVFNFRGYRFSEGKISISSQVKDGMKVMKFVEKMAENQIFDSKTVNIIAHDFGAYIALLLCSKINIINKLVLLSPILDLKRHVYDKEFPKILEYINRFLPSNIKGIDDVNNFIQMTKKELSKKAFQIDKAIRKLKIKKLKIIIGEMDKVTPISEINDFFQNANNFPEISIIKHMDYDCIEDEDIDKLNEEIKKYFNS